MANPVGEGSGPRPLSQPPPPGLRTTHGLSGLVHVHDHVQIHVQDEVEVQVEVPRPVISGPRSLLPPDSRQVSSTSATGSKSTSKTRSRSKSRFLARDFRPLIPASSGFPAADKTQLVRSRPRPRPRPSPRPGRGRGPGRGFRSPGPCLRAADNTRLVRSRPRPRPRPRPGRGRGPGRGFRPPAPGSQFPAPNCQPLLWLPVPLVRLSSGPLFQQPALFGQLLVLQRVQYLNRLLPGQSAIALSRLGCLGVGGLWLVLRC